MILLLTDLIGLTFYTLITLDFPFSGSADIVPKKRGSSLFQVGEDETRKNNLELWNSGTQEKEMEQECYFEPKRRAS